MLYCLLLLLLMQSAEYVGGGVVPHHHSPLHQSHALFPPRVRRQLQTARHLTPHRTGHPARTITGDHTFSEMTLITLASLRA